MKNFSFSDSVVILERWGDFYNVSFDSVDISSRTLSLRQLDRNSITLQSDSLRLNFCRICVYKEMSSHHPYPSYPLPGVYVKSYGHGMGLIGVQYNRRDLVAVKLTGSVFVPAGVDTFKIDLESQQVSVQHANARFANPHWTNIYRMKRMERTVMEMVQIHSSRDDALYYHLSSFTPRFI